MFRSIKLSLIMMMACILFNLPKSSIAQPFFQPSSINENIISGIASPLHINDVTCNSTQNAAFPDYVSDLYVSTWLNVTTGLYWKRTQMNNPNIIINEGLIAPPFTGNVHGAAIVYNPVPGSANNYAIAIVYANVTGGYIAFYEWTITGPVLISTQQVIVSNNIWRMSIDAHWLYSYSVAIGLGNGDMYSFGGWPGQPSTFPLVGPLKQIYCPIAPLGKGINPDVAMNHGGTIGTGLKTYYTYVIDNQQIGISWVDFDDLINAGGAITLNSATGTGVLGIKIGSSGTPGFDGAFPKIDAPEHSGDRWAVVASEVDYNTGTSTYNSYIRTAYDVNSGPQEQTLNNNSLPTTTEDLSAGSPFVYPTLPAVAFHSDGTHLHYAWGKTIDHWELGDHDYIGMMFDPAGGGTGDVVPGSNGEGYRIIDFNPNYIPMYRAIALTGQDETSNDMFIVFTADDLNYPPYSYMECLYYKHVDWNTIPAIGYRGEGNNKDESCSDKLIQNYYPNPIKDKGLTLELNVLNMADNIEVNIYDITGRVLHNFKGKIEEINHHLSNIATNGAKGLWTVQVISHTSGKSESVRVSVQ